MKNLLFIIVFGLFGSFSFSQDYYERAAKDFFESDKYQPREYQKFEEAVEFNEKDFSFKFGKKVVQLSPENSNLKYFFLSGAFNPDLIFGKGTTVFDKEEYDSMNEIQKLFFNMGRNDSISICCFHSFEKINPDPTVRRYSFWLFRKEMTNPTEYYIEFFNPKATRETSTEEFGKDAVMTFFVERGTII